MAPGGGTVGSTLPPCGAVGWNGKDGDPTATGWWEPAGKIRYDSVGRQGRRAFASPHTPYPVLIQPELLVGQDFSAPVLGPPRDDPSKCVIPHGDDSSPWARFVAAQSSRYQDRSTSLADISSIVARWSM